MAAYQNLITQSMYDKQLDSGKGTLLHLCDDVIQQEVSCILFVLSLLFSLCVSENLVDFPAKSNENIVYIFLLCLYFESKRGYIPLTI